MITTDQLNRYNETKGRQLLKSDTDVDFARRYEEHHENGVRLYVDMLRMANETIPEVAQVLKSYNIDLKADYRMWGGYDDEFVALCDDEPFSELDEKYGFARVRLTDIAKALKSYVMDLAMMPEPMTDRARGYVKLIELMDNN